MKGKQIQKKYVAGVAVLLVLAVAVALFFQVKKSNATATEEIKEETEENVTEEETEENETETEEEETEEQAEETKAVALTIDNLDFFTTVTGQDGELLLNEVTAYVKRNSLSVTSGDVMLYAPNVQADQTADILNQETGEAAEVFFVELYGEDECILDCWWCTSSKVLKVGVTVTSTDDYYNRWVPH